MTAFQELPWVACVEHYAELESTNDYALYRAIERELPTPLLVLADRQTAGRGRGGKTWWSTEGSLTFSLVLCADQLGLAAEVIPQISLATATAICRAFATELPDQAFRIKWPNDVQAKNRKIAGILLEIPNTRAIDKRRMVLGVGINLNNSFQSAPEPLRESCISLSDLSGFRYCRESILGQLLASLASTISALARRDVQLPKMWSSLCALRGRKVKIEQSDGVVTGRVLAIDVSGALVLQTAAEAVTVRMGTVASVEE